MSEYKSLKQIAAEVRSELRRALPDHTFSVTVKNFQWSGSITVAAMAGPQPLLSGGDGHEQLNSYQLLREEKVSLNGVVSPLTLEGWSVMRRAAQILASHHWDESEPQTDYFCCNFYMHVHVGKWDKPYQVKGK